MGGSAAAATSTGFSERVTLDLAPAAAPTYVFPLTLHGLAASLENNAVVFRNPQNEIVAASAPLTMWDSTVDADGNPTHQVPVEAKLAQAAGVTSLVLTPSMAFLNDPATAYPVTVDPDVSTVTQEGDTYVSSQDPNVSYYNNYFVQSGRDADGLYRAYEKFTIDPYVGKDILSASLKLWQIGAPDCTSRASIVYPTTIPTNSGLT